MKLLIAALATIAISTQLSAQEFPTPKPTDAHKILASEAGTWDAEVKMYFQGPAGPAMEYEGVETNEMVSGGMYSRSTFTCQMGDTEFEGHGLVGYDSRTEEYTGVWVDNFTSAPTQIKGTYDAEEKTLTMFSTVFDEDSGVEMKQKQVTTFVDEETRTFVIFLLIEAGDQELEVKIMEMTSKKRG